MKKALVVLSLVLAVAGVVLSSTAKAESSFSFSVSDRDGYGRPQHDRGHGGPRFDRGHGPRERHWRDYRHHGRPVYYAPPVIYAQPIRPVVYQQTIIQPAPSYYTNSSVVAQPSSPTYYDGNGQLCREYQTSGWVGGSRGQVYGTACFQPDGSWRVVD